MKQPFLLKVRNVQGAKKWIYDPFYLSFGFTYVRKQSDPVPQSVIMLWNSFWAFKETTTDGNVTK